MSSPRTVEAAATDAAAPEAVAPDRSNEAVGAMRAPAWVRRVPPLAWVVLAVAAVDVALRVSGNRTAASPGDPVVLFFVVLGLLAAAAPFALLAAALAGPTTGSARRALLLGAGCLALAELAILVMVLADPFDLDPPSSAVNPWQPAAIASLAVTILGVLGPALLALGVVRAVADASRGREVPFDGERSSLPGVVLLLGFIASVARFGVTLIGVLLLDPEADLLPGPLDLAAAFVACFAPLAWAAVAAAALTARRPAATGWRWLVAGSAGVLVSRLAHATVTVVLALAGWIGDLEAAIHETLFRVEGVAAVLGVTGLLALAAGFAVGPTGAAGPPARPKGIEAEAAEAV